MSYIIELVRHGDKGPEHVGYYSEEGDITNSKDNVLRFSNYNTAMYDVEKLNESFKLAKNEYFRIGDN
jgi:hypothetical protein